VRKLNLAEIKVYSKKGGPNIITTNTLVTKPSGWYGDMYPGTNFVDGDTNTFTHTSGNDVPWVKVDLGSMIDIYKIEIYNRVDCCQERVLDAVLQILNDQNTIIYTSDAVKSTESAYTWFPPSSAFKVGTRDALSPETCITGTFVSICI
jgi:hypothetical protein